MPGVFANSEPQAIRTMFEVDNSQPTTSIQVRLADGARLACRMNVTRTASDIRSFINAGWVVGWLVGWIRSTPGAASHPYTIGTTSPNRILRDPSQTGEAAGIKGSVVVSVGCE
ncbi:SEP protein, partial [Rhizoctonia solani]